MEERSETGSNPACVIDRSPPAGAHVDMWDEASFVVPGMHTLKKPITQPAMCGCSAPSHKRSALARNSKLRRSFYFWRPAPAS